MKRFIRKVRLKGRKWQMWRSPFKKLSKDLTASG